MKIPGNVDPGRFAREGTRLTGTLSPAQLPRLAEMLFDGSGSIDYEVTGYLTDQGEPAFHLQFSGEMALRCQRCMDRLAHKVQSARDLIMVPDMGEFEPVEDEQESIDTIPYAPSVNMLDLLDEEVILSLPIAPRHPEGQCEARVDPPDPESASSPFSVLSRLKQ